MNEKIKIEENKSDGILKILGELPKGTVINEKALSRIFKRQNISIKRAITRGEIPPPVKLFGEPSWTIESILNHINEKLDKAKKNLEKQQKKMASLSP